MQGSPLATHILEVNEVGKEINHLLVRIQSLIDELSAKKERSAEEEINFSTLIRYRDFIKGNETVRQQKILQSEKAQFKKNALCLTEEELLPAFIKSMEKRCSVATSDKAENAALELWFEDGGFYDDGKGIDLNRWLDESEVYHTIRCLVAQREALSQSVAVFPVFNPDHYEQTVKVTAHNKIKAELLELIYPKELNEIKQKLAQENLHNAQAKEAIFENETEKLLSGTYGYRFGFMSELQEDQAPEENKIYIEKEGERLKYKLKTSEGIIESIFDKKVALFGKYDFALWDALPKTGPDIATLYFAKDENGNLQYQVMNPKGKVIKNTLNLKIEGELTVDKLIPLKSQILTMTAIKGETGFDIDGEMREEALDFLSHSMLKETALKGYTKMNCADQLEEEVANILKESQITRSKTFEYYLQTAVQNSHLLGNPAQPGIAFEKCQQWIIPFRVNNNHFTVAVVHLETVGDKKKAHIRYYDSMGSNLNEYMQKRFKDFFAQSLGVEVDYTCISKRDQKKEAHNCGIYAAYKGIDLANENIQANEAPLLPNYLNDLDDTEYQWRFNRYRYDIAMLLQQFGFKIPVSDRLKDAVLRQDNMKQINVELKQKAALFEEVLGIAKEKEIKETQKIGDEAVNKENKKLFKQLKSYNKIAIKQIEALKAKKEEEMTPEEKAYLSNLDGLHNAFEAGEGELNKGVHAVPPSASQDPAEEAYTGDEWIEAIVLYAAMALLAYVAYFAWPYLVAEISLSGILTVGMGMLVLVGAYTTLSYFLEEEDPEIKLDLDQKMPKEERKAKRREDPDLEPSKKSVLAQYQSHKERKKAANENSGPKCEPDSPQSKPILSK